MINLKLITENTARDIRSGDGRVSILTQTALLVFLLTLTLTSASIQNYLSSNLDQMLGADMVIESHTPIGRPAREQLESKVTGLSKTELIFITLTFEDKWERVQLKLVDDAYPLQGQMQIGENPAAVSRPADQGPQKGEIWLGPRLATKLGARVGHTIVLAEQPLRITQILFHEPDRIMEGHSVALRAMVNAQSTNNLSLHYSGGRSRYLISADEPALQDVENWTNDTLPGASIVKKYGGQHPLAGFWRRTENFLGLASVILFFMGAVALDMTNRRWLAKTRYRLAIYASFGTSMGRATAMAMIEWLFTFLLSLFVASLLAAGAYMLILGELQSYFPGLIAGWYPVAALKTVGLVFLLLLALQIPSFIQLRQASLLSLIRSTTEGNFIWHRLFWGLAAVSGLAAAYSDNLLLTGMTLTAIAVALLLMIALTWLILWTGDLWGRRRSGLLPFAFFIMRQRLFTKSAQIVGLGLCGLLLLFTLMLMRDMGSMMEGYGRTHNGNLLVSEAQANQVDAIHTWAEKNNSAVRQLRPFVSAKLIEVNGQRLADYMQKPSDTLATLKDPIRLSWSNSIPANNQLTGGTWWVPDTENWQQISTEPEVMTDMGFQYGDKLTYQIGEEQHEFTLTASHAFKPGGSSITFWFQIPTSAREHINAPTRYMGSMELPDSAWSELSSLWQRYPTLALVPLKELTQRFDRILGIVTKVTNGYAGMVLLLALFVLAASVSGYRADDQQKNGLLMSMGLRKKDCLWLNFYDWGVTALIASLGAVAGTWVAGHLIYEAQFGLSYNPNILWLLGTISVMILLVCSVGYLACRQSLKVSARDLLA
jgi:putative ABC transport system permease protein